MRTGATAREQTEVPQTAVLLLAELVVQSQLQPMRLVVVVALVGMEVAVELELTLVLPAVVAVEVAVQVILMRAIHLSRIAKEVVKAQVTPAILTVVRLVVVATAGQAVVSVQPALTARY